MLYGYCRISTSKQSIDRQERNILEAYPSAKIIKEVFTGTKIEGRKEFERLIKRLKAGDTVVFDEVSRMSRNADEGFALYQELFTKGVNLVFLKEPHINTEVFQDTQQLALVGDDIADIYLEATNRVLMLLAKKQIETAFEQAQKEVDYLHKRTKEGIETARRNGKQIGLKEGTKLTTKKSLSKKQDMVKYCACFNGTMSDTEFITKIGGISRNTFYKYKRELLSELATVDSADES